MFIVLDFATDADALYMAQIVTEELSGGKAQTLAVGDATDCAIALLDHPALEELDHAEHERLFWACNRVLGRLASAALRRAEIAPAVERDEDGDVIAEPTPTIAVDATRGVRDALDEADGDG